MKLALENVLTGNRRFFETQQSASLFLQKHEDYIENSVKEGRKIVTDRLGNEYKIIHVIG